VNGEPTDSRLGAATRGILRIKLDGDGPCGALVLSGDRACRRSTSCVDALIRLRAEPLPEDSLLGRTHYTVGLISGGIAPNVIPPHAEAEVMFRTVGPAAALLPIVDRLRDLVEPTTVLEVPAVTLKTLAGLETAVFPFTTDIPFLSSWGTPLLFGPGSVLVAHTDHEHVAMDELAAAVDRYVEFALALRQDE
jgi:acetylornithine deacetylase